MSAVPAIPQNPPVAPLCDPLLVTKLFIPPARTGLVSRPRLQKQLNEALHARLILVSAPAGFGKTTLLSEWIRDFRLRIDDLPTGAAHQEGVVNPQPKIVNRFAWLSLDAADDDPARFLRYLVAALQKASSGIGETALDLFRALQPPPVEALLTVLLNDMAALPTPILLVLDDYHLIDNHTIHEALAYLVDHLPPTGHVVLSTRVDPPLPLARWRSRGQLLEVRADDLRFAPEEAAHFLNQVMGLELAPQDVSALGERTEGWIAGLQMAALSLRGRPDAAAFVQSFGGSHRYVLDYLVEEVLESQPETVQQFLLQTSILERLCGPLCDAVTGQSDGQAMLEHLERANLFLVPLDEKRRWYRYHQLFAELLRYRVRQQRAGSDAALHSQAAAWFAQNDLVSEAVAHWLAAQEFAHAAESIEQWAFSLLARGESTTLLSWLQTLPSEIVAGRPWLCIWKAWALVRMGRLEDSAPLLLQAESALEPPTGRYQEMRGYIALIRATIANLQKQPALAAEQARLAQESLPAQSWLALSSAAFQLGHAYLNQGDLAAAEQVWQEVIRLATAADDLYTTAAATAELANLNRIQGKLGLAAALFRQRLEEVRSRRDEILSPTGVLQTGLASVLYEMDNLAEARHLVEEGMEYSRKGGRPNSLSYGHMACASLFQAEGDLGGAAVELQEAEKLVRNHDVYPRTAIDVKTRQVALALAQGDLDTAVRWAEAQGPDMAGPLLVAHEVEYIVVARVWLAQGKLPEVLALLERLAAATRKGGRNGRLIQVLVLQSLAQWSQGSPAHALRSLKEALLLAEPEGYVRTFLDEGAPLAELLRLGASRRVWTEPRLAVYAQRLSAAFPAAAPTSMPQPPTANLIEPLSDRELEVLRLVAAGLSNQEIAEQLVLAVGTVKTHIHNIYGKLGVQTRVQAIARSRELGLL